jgi:hypothetical protein
MEIIFSLSPFIIIASFIFAFIESTYTEAFSRRTFLRGIPVFKRKFDATNLNRFFAKKDMLETQEGVIKYLEEKIVFFRTDNDRPAFPNMTIIPVRATGALNENNELTVTGRIPLAVVTLFLCFATLPILALVRDGSSPAILFLAGVLFLFGYGYTTQRKKLISMINTFELNLQYTQE